MNPQHQSTRGLALMVLQTRTLEISLMPQRAVVHVAIPCDLGLVHVASVPW